jgi:transmembrane sensor
MDKQRLLEEKRRVAEQAAEWLCVLEDATAEQLASFTDWVRESPAHAREFLFMSALDAELGKIDPQRRVQIERVLAEASANVVPISAGLEQRDVGTGSGAASTAPRARRLERWAAASVAGVALIVTLAWQWSVQANRHETAVGEQRTLTLADGSTVYLNSDSRLNVQLSDDARDIQLITGEAMFKVAHDARRPFRVHAGVSVIQAVGTQFNVDRRPSGTMISVVEGKVQITTRAEAPQPATISSPQLVAGDEMRIANDGKLERRARVDPAAIAVWRQHRLVFRDDTLEDIAAGFNRYNQTPRIVVVGDAARARRYTAVFDADDPLSLAKFLEGEGDLLLENGKDELVIRQNGE